MEAVNASRRLSGVALIAAQLAFVPKTAPAQTGAFNDKGGTVEVSAVQEWFHRELEPSAYADTRWSVTSFLFTYDAAAWLRLGMQGGLSQYESDDFPGSEFQRYVAGGTVAARPWQRGNWDVSACGRYLETFDFDDSATALHKRVRSIAVAAALTRRFSVVHQAVALWGGPIYVDDRIQTYPFDSRDAVESTSGAAVGAAAGGRVVIAGYVVLFGYVNYVEELQGGIGISLRAGEGGF